MNAKMKYAKNIIIAIFMIFFFCNYFFADWRFISEGLEDAYWIIFFALGILAFTFLLKFITDRIKWSPLLIAITVSIAFPIIYLFLIQFEVTRDSILPILFSDFLCFCFVLIFLSILKISKLATGIIITAIILLISYFQINPIDTVKYLNDRKLVSQKSDEKVVVVDIKNYKNNEIFQDTITVKDRWIFRKILKR